MLKWKIASRHQFLKTKPIGLDSHISSGLQLYLVAHAGRAQMVSSHTILLQHWLLSTGTVELSTAIQLLRPRGAVHYSCCHLITSHVASLISEGWEMACVSDVWVRGAWKCRSFSISSPTPDSRWLHSGHFCCCLFFLYYYSWNWPDASFKMKSLVFQLYLLHFKTSIAKCDQCLLLWRPQRWNIFIIVENCIGQ